MHDATKLLPAWEALARDAAEANCFYGPEMLVPALQHLAGGQNVRLIEAWRDGLLIGILPVTIAPRHGRYPIRNITNWVHRHCFFGAPLIRRGHETDAWEQFLAMLDAADWAPGFLHLTALDEDGANAAALHELCRRQERGLRILHRHQRALLHSELSSDAYQERHISAKRRKEMRRQRKRLEELGQVRSRLLTDPAELDQWCDDFLAIEQSGWKGAQGTALACNQEDTEFFRECVARAFTAGALKFHRLDFKDWPIAMLINFHVGEGSFAFKTAFDETMARFSPGVLIEIENLRLILDAPGTVWVDSCAAPNHPMIDGIWAERRKIAQYRVQLKGPSRLLAWHAVKAADSLGPIVKLIKRGIG